jgi:hypothetical protein
LLHCVYDIKCLYGGAGVVQARHCCSVRAAARSVPALA